MSNYLKDLEDSRLLFKTFCDGLMYGLFFYHGETLHRVVSIEGLDDTVNGTYPIKECRPCLRPMSSMTEDETIEYHRLRVNSNISGEFALFVDWLNKKHLDYRGLIEKGLAEEWEEKRTQA